MKPIRKNIDRLLKEGTFCGHKKTENTCKKILKYLFITDSVDELI
jgi:hypothetical protein